MDADSGAKALEERRLQELRRLKILDTPPDLDADSVVKLAADICQTPMAMISLVDASRQWFKARIGVDAPETPRDISFCTHTVAEKKVFIVEDASTDCRFKESPLVVGNPHIRFYAGAQLTTSAGYNIGALCVADEKPRKLTTNQIESLETLARQIVSNFEHQRLGQESVDREAFLSETLAMIPGLVSYVTADLIYVYANPSYCRWYNQPVEEIIGRSVIDVIGTANFSAISSHFRNALAGETQIFQAQLQLPGEMGGPRDVLAHYKPHFVNGSVAGLYIFVNDVTEVTKAKDEATSTAKQLQDAHDQLLANESEFRAIFDHAPVGMAELDSSLRLIRFNRAFCVMLEYEPEELIGRRILDLTVAENRDESLSRLNQVQSDHGSVLAYEKSYIAKSGRIVPARVSTKTVRHSSGANRVFGVVQDRTNELKSEKQLKETQARLIAASKLTSLGEMAGGIAHEINNPLAIIQGKSDLLLRKLEHSAVSPDEVRAGLEVISKTSGRIAKIVTGLRTFSSPQRDEHKTAISIRKVVEDTLALCSERFKHHSVSLQCDEIPDLPILCDAVQLSQVIMNILSNSFDAVVGHDSAWVHLTFDPAGENFLLRITDSGSGIPEKVVANMMAPFFTTKETGKGTGLGLSISSGIVAAHGGTLTYELHENHTSFVVSLPHPKSQVAA